MPPSADTRSTPLASRLAAFVGRLLPQRRSPGRSRGPAGSEPVPVCANLEDLSVAQVVHDLRNLLAVILGCAENLQQHLEAGQADRDLVELRRSVERASALTRELLLSARPRRADRGPVDLNQAIATAADRLASAVGDRIELRLSLTDMPVAVSAGAAEIDRILLNLAQNARDAMPDGGVLTVETDVAYTNPRRAGDSPSHGRLTVADTGRGMPPEVRARIFEPFFTTKELGTGLGLSSVALTVRHLGGTLSVDSRPGAGTRVTIKLPHADGRWKGEG